MEINIPEVHADVVSAFERYEVALGENDLDVLRELFWASDMTLRYGPAEILCGAEAIHAFRAARPNVPRPRTLFATAITTFGTDFAVANTQYRNQGSERAGRQSQTWVRMAEGWRIVSAHVSFLED